jgi:hypothetical protein
MAFETNAPKRWVFSVSLALGIFALVIYFFGALAATPEGYLPVTFYAFWMMVAAWLLLIAGALLRDL